MKDLDSRLMHEQTALNRRDFLTCTAGRAVCPMSQYVPHSIVILLSLMIGVAREMP